MLLMGMVVNEHTIKRKGILCQFLYPIFIAELNQEIPLC